MTNRRTIIAFSAIAIFCGVNATCHSQTLYEEDFSTGDAALGIWESVWSSGPGSYSAASGNLVITGSHALSITGQPNVASLSETSVRARVALDGTSSGGIGLLASGDPSTLTTYQAGIDPDEGELYLGWNDPTAFEAFVTIPTDIDLKAGEQAILQFDVFGDEMALWAWRAGELMPSDPQLRHTDTTVRLAPGSPGILVDNLAAPGTSSAIIYDFRVDNVSIQDVPEPSAGTLAIGILASFLLVVRRSRRDN